MGTSSLNSEAWPKWVVPQSVQLIGLPYTVVGRIPCQGQCVIYVTNDNHTWRPSPSRGSVGQLCSSEWLFVGSPCFARCSITCNSCAENAPAFHSLVVMRCHDGERQPDSPPVLLPEAGDIAVNQTVRSSCLSICASGGRERK